MRSRAHKYGARKTVVQGIAFDSKRESQVYIDLNCLVLAGVITELQRQPRFDLCINGQRIGTYTADFAYTQADGQRVIVDVKGVRTAVYMLKKKLMKALHGITITEVE